MNSVRPRSNTKKESTYLWDFRSEFLLFSKIAQFFIEIFLKLEHLLGRGRIWIVYAELLSIKIFLKLQELCVIGAPK